MLLCGIIDELEKDSTNQLSYYFYQATEKSLNNATAVLRGLIYSLEVQCPRLVSYVRKEHDSGGWQRYEGLNAWEVMSKILEAMVRDPVLDGVILIVNALEECGMDRSKLLNFIARISSSSPAKWIVSGRNWLGIEETLDNTTHKVALRLELNEEFVSDTIRTFTQSIPGEETGGTQEHLIDNSNGTFLWAALVCQELADYRVRKKHTLNALKAFPPGLEPLYGWKIEQISDSKDADLCKEVLAVVSVVYRPVALQMFRFVFLHGVATERFGKTR
ncbi:vegetative incompatibility protein HET-E-1 [Colletotrichum liriopes]|uniref:Vegetative incompatibility protein HET-E-1 n=1 Tax=Colletotrichum liriopes TaxID=708192 RepID=A0AA37GBG7_9PEZI|nr:vegetative incompatibility protein HET-E-1 [Colletotrichum liriopes]